MQVTRTELLPGVNLCAVQTHKFKSSYMSVQFLAPLTGEDATLNALTPMVLRRGTERCPDMERLSAALDELYGGSVEPAIRRKGNTQCVGFAASFLDDAYATETGNILEQAAGLLGELLLRPATENGGFLSEYVEGERVNLVDRIRAQKNDKRQYAALRLSQLMFRLPDRLGDEARAAAITPETLWVRYQALFSNPIQIYYAGSAQSARVEQAFRHALAGLPQGRNAVAKPAAPKFNAESRAAENVEEHLDVTQGKLSMGFATGVRCTDPDFPALLLFNAMFGGATTSKLFLNVREKLSLCYYASSQVEKFQGAVLLSSGVEFSKRGEAEAEILAQLEHCKAGEFDASELEAARRSLISSYRTLLDSQSRMEDFWLGQAVVEGDDPETLIKKLEQVTAEQVASVASRAILQTTYFLSGKESAYGQ